MTFSIPDKIRGFLFSPSEAFWKVRDEDLRDTMIYFIVISIIYTLLSTLITGIAISKHPALVLFGLGFGSGNIVLSFCIILVLSLVMALAYALWLHLWIILICGKRGVEKTIKTAFYYLTPTMLIGWIPVIGAFAASIWSVVIGIIGVQELHQVSFGKALISILLSLITAGILVGVLFGPLIAEVIASGPALIGPYHYRPVL
ncbi:MAG: YIP1 family protein [Methanoregulaceae archaeon]|nr:YIP1 family protein [Methanoregulaceae archaeon]